MQIIRVDSIDDERLAAYVNLTELQLRNRLEPEKGIFIAESPKVIDRALAAGREPLSLLVEEPWLEGMAGEFADIDAHWGPDVPVYVASPEQLRRLTGYRLHRGAIAAMRRWKLPTVTELLTRTRARRVAVLENIVDHTNVGAIMRSAAALDVDAVLVTPSCADPLYRRAARVSMGTVFQVPWTRIGGDDIARDETRRDRSHALREQASRDRSPITQAQIDDVVANGGADGKRAWPDAGLAELHGLGFTTAAMALTDDSISLQALTDRLELPADDPDYVDKLALIFGTEGDGLSRRTIAHADLTVKIPMSHGVDSLNVAASSAVAFYATRVRD
ncbi:TrmH family RNA methyltransferase [Bifidobacterium choloepi]|uniref:RNA methyltransferase n=1 Tax=Bifidobacterium choloepi TaxID=2614131 RepID=A0A6I5NCP7_9BIFI|nr:RNA methyltransferase [Bifidobacterium choloepi]NEG69244.1 RNA methyltransferase [Bifidobacterium choloepi]